MDLKYQHLTRRFRKEKKILQDAQALCCKDTALLQQIQEREKFVSDILREISTIHRDLYASKKKEKPHQIQSTGACCVLSELRL